MNKKEIIELVEKELKDFSRRVPAGTIMAWAGPDENIPKGWAVCDGKEISSMDNLELFDAIGTNWGGDGAPMYCIPDLRGYFLRGVDTNEDTYLVDPDRDTRKDKNGTIAAKVGSYQIDEFRKHAHQVYQSGNYGEGERANSEHHMSGNWNRKHQGSEGGNETRPKNAYVHWIIKL